MTLACNSPTGLMNPTLSNLFCSPDKRASEVEVLPTCCLVAATKIGLCFFEEKLRRDKFFDVNRFVSLGKVDFLMMPQISIWTVKNKDSK